MGMADLSLTFANSESRMTIPRLPLTAIVATLVVVTLGGCGAAAGTAAADVTPTLSHGSSGAAAASGAASGTASSAAPAAPDPVTPQPTPADSGKQPEPVAYRLPAAAPQSGQQTPSPAPVDPAVDHWTSIVADVTAEAARLGVASISWVETTACGTTASFSSRNASVYGCTTWGTGGTVVQISTGTGDPNSYGNQDRLHTAMLDVIRHEAAHAAIANLGCWNQQDPEAYADAWSVMYHGGSPIYGPVAPATRALITAAHDHGICPP
jgi:hypothetical protein